jgi:altronate hydrolase
LQIHTDDNVVVALQDLSAGLVCELANQSVQLQHQIPAKHKFTLKELSKGAQVIMYGVVVGTCMEEIPKGGLVGTHNVAHKASSYSIQSMEMSWVPPDVSKWREKTFDGYHRNDGSVGTANYWLVVPLVFCENRNLDVISEALCESLGYPTKKDFRVNTQALVDGYKSGASVDELMELSIVSTRDELVHTRQFPNVDGIKFLKHQGGCGGSPDDLTMLCNLLAGYITHSNVAGATILSLGCQHAQIELMQQTINKKDPNFDKPVYYLEQQKSKDERSFIEDAVKQTFIGLTQANHISRKPAPLHHIKLGLECGGSDGFSGISANPALGYTSDLLVALGGTAILSEFPELNGVEQELVNRCTSRELAQKFSDLMSAYSKSAQAVNAGFENNPSPGNIKDGLITDAIKSAGAAKKGGTSPINEVLDYGESSRIPGLSLLCTPGNDVESTTGLAGSGANIMVFTTGLGTPTGNPVAPVIKMSTNNKLYQKMADIIDINAGTIISGDSTIQEKGEELLDYIIEVASGRSIPAAVRLLQEDFIPWKRGVSL